MPGTYETDLHHCRCGKTNNKSSNNNGFCEKCHDYCDFHKYIFTLGKECPKCKAERERAALEERDGKQRERQVEEDEKKRKEDEYWGVGGGRKGKLRGSKKS